MSDPKEKKPGQAPEKKSGRAKPAGKPAPRSPRRNTGGPKASAQKTPPLTTQQKILRGLYIALTVISGIIVLAYIGVNLFAAPPDVNKPGHGVVDVTRPPMVTQMVDDKTGEIIEIEIPGLPANRKKEFYTFLLVGQSQDEGGKLTDTMMLVAYDVPNQKLSVLNLPRDTYVRYNGDPVLLNSIFNRGSWRAKKGEDPDQKGMEALKKEVQELTGIYPDFEVVIQWEALGELVDAIGGVYFDVPFNMYYNDLSQHFKIDVKKGYQLLDGEAAMGVVRWRQNSIGDTGMKDSHYGYAEGDLGRIKTQQAFMKAVLAKCLQPETLLGNLGEYIDIFQKNVVTDLSVANMAYFGKSAIGGLDMDNVTFITLPNTYAGNGHLLPLGNQIVKAVNENFNPYEENIRLGELDLVTAIALPTATPDPEETEDPDASESPDASEKPDSSAGPRPTEGEDVVLPPGSFARPSASPDPSGSPRPSGSATPSASPKPGGSKAPDNSPDPMESGEPNRSPKPSESEKPGTTPAPTAEPTAAPTATPEPPADTPTPVFTPPPMEEEPLLPPM